MTTQQNLRVIVRGAYDVQKLRIQMGNRIVANFKAKLGQAPSESEEELDAEGKQVLDDLRASYIKITDGVTDELGAKIAAETTQQKAESLVAAATGKAPKKKRTPSKNAKFPKKEEFKGDELISSYTELCLFGQYIDLERHESKHFRQMEEILKDFPIYNEFLEPIKGIGPAMAGVIVSEIDIHKAKYPSSLWMYAGLDVAQDGLGRSRRKEHLIKRAYTTAKGDEAERDSVTFNPFLKTKLVGVLATSFLRVGDNPYRTIYLNYKHRMESHARFGVHNDDKKDDKGYFITSKKRRHNQALRYMIKMFLKDLYNAWRRIEGLPVAPTYQEAKLGHKHGGAS